LVKGKKKIRRRRPGAAPKIYWTDDTQNAILEWQDEESLETKQTIYQSRIFPAFDKLVENLIFLYGFRAVNSYDIFKADCVSFLYEQLPKFDRSKGYKTFSYYNQIAKNYLIIQTKDRQKELRRSVSIDDKEALGHDEVRSLEEYCTVPSPDDQIIDVEKRTAILKIIFEVQRKIVGGGSLETRVMDCIVDLFSKADELPFLNKRAVFIYIREITGVTPKQLTTVMSIIRKEYKELRGTDEFAFF